MRIGENTKIYQFNGSHFWSSLRYIVPKKSNQQFPPKTCKELGKLKKFEKLTKLTKVINFPYQTTSGYSPIL